MMDVNPSEDGSCRLAKHVFEAVNGRPVDDRSFLAFAIVASDNNARGSVNDAAEGLIF